MLKAKYNPKTKKWDIQIRYVDAFNVSHKTTKRGFTTAHEAESYAIDFLGNRSKSPDKLFKFLVDDYCNYNKVHKKDSTFDTQAIIIAKHILPILGNQKICDIDYNMILAWQAMIINKQLSDTYTYQINCILESIFAFAQKAYRLKENPVKMNKKIGKAKNPHTDYWTAEDFTRFIITLTDEDANSRAHIKRKIPTEPLVVAFHILFYLGLRKGELLSLCKSNIDFDNHRLIITTTYRRKNKNDYQTSPKTDSSKRILPIPSKIYNMLVDYINKLDLKADDRIFYMLSKDCLRRAMISTAKLAKLKVMRIHDLRHSTASLLFHEGIEANVAAKILGHKSVKTTLDIYTHFGNDKVNDAISKLDDLI